VLGSKGSGKTHWTKALVDAEAGSRSVLVWDPVIEWPARLGGRRFDASPSPAAWLRVRAATTSPAPLAVRFQGCDEDEADLLVAIAWCRPGALVVFEEVQNLCPAGTAPRWLRKAIATARHRAVSLVFTSQRPALVPKDVIANADRLVVFRLGYDDDRAAVYRSTGDRRFLTETAGLRVGAFLDSKHVSQPREHRQGRRHRGRHPLPAGDDGPGRQARRLIDPRAP
jgi:hypothetical protein